LGITSGLSSLTSSFEMLYYCLSSSPLHPSRREVAVPRVAAWPPTLAPQMTTQFQASALDRLTCCCPTTKSPSTNVQQCVALRMTVIRKGTSIDPMPWPPWRKQAQVTGVAPTAPLLCAFLAVHPCPTRIGLTVLHPHQR
jgi:hypothetical protein